MTLTRTKFESLTAKLLSRLLIPLREVALMSGVNLAGESMNSDKQAVQLNDLYDPIQELSAESVGLLKKKQQSGRKNAKSQKKEKVSFGRELNRLKVETGDASIVSFPGGNNLHTAICIMSVV